MKNIPILETERLILRKIEVADAPFFYKLLNSKGWLQYIGDRNIRTVADAEKQIINTYIPSYTVHGYGSYLVIDKESGEPIGTCGMYKRENLEHPDIGFAFLPDFTGKGYGYESAYVVLNHAFNHMNIKKVLAFTLPTNIPSIRLLEKLGLKNEGDYHMPNDDETLLLFST